MSTKHAGATLAGIVLLLMLCAIAQAAPSRSFNFTYRADIPISNPSAKKVEAWIPLPREDAFQRVRNVKIDTPAYFEIVDQHSKWKSRCTPRGFGAAAHVYRRHDCVRGHPARGGRRHGRGRAQYS